MNPAISILQDMFAASAELSWQHLLNGDEPLALHELNCAREKILEIQQIKQSDPSHKSDRSDQPLLLDITAEVTPANEQPTPESENATRPHPNHRRRKTPAS